MKVFSTRLVSLSVCLVVVRFGGAWNIQRPIASSTATTTTTRLFADKSVSTTISTQQDFSVLDGVAEFEKWFAAVPGADCERSICHADFGNLRGLTCDSSSLASKDWMTIPRSVVLQSDFTQSDWDAKLAQQLWEEVVKGSSSAISGYVALLTKGTTSWRNGDSTPPSTAPDALRHWSPEEKKVLSSSAEGQRLLGLEQQQNEIWREKFKSVKGMTYEQYAWAMEVVHSRAFCGDFGVGNGSAIPNAIAVAAPAIAGAAGFVYYVPFHGQNDAILLALAAFAAVPTLLRTLKQDAPVAVLLPLIDSANHLQEAESSIEYSAVKGCFTLSGGASCLVKESQDQKHPQLYISYGKKKDTELLLNYGFLRNVDSSGDATTRRKRLAERFLNANSQ